LRYQMDEALKSGESRAKELEEGIAKCTRSLRNIHLAQERFTTAH
jgi:hypothetical protein